MVLSCGGPQASSAPAPQRDVLTREEILNSVHANLDLFQAIQGLRPRFLLRPPGVRGSLPPTAVYFDNIRQTGLEALRTVRASFVDEVRYIGPTQSENELGPTAAGGALLVRLYHPE